MIQKRKVEKAEGKKRKVQAFGFAFFFFWGVA